MQKNLNKKCVNGIAVTRSLRAPGAEMVGRAAALKFKDGVAGAFHLHPRRTQIGAHVCALQRFAHIPQQKVHIMAAVAEELAASQPGSRRCPLVLIIRILLRPDGHME